MSIIEEFYQSLQLDCSDEKRIADAKQDDIITSYILTTRNDMNARRETDLCLWCDEMWSVDHSCENAPDYNCMFTFGEEGEGVALVKVPKKSLKLLSKNYLQDEALISCAHNQLDEMREPNSCISQGKSVVACTHNVFDESPEPEVSLNQAQMIEISLSHQMFYEMPLPDFIREMAQNAKVEEDKASELDPDEQKPNARNMFDKMCEPENESISAVTAKEHENIVLPTLIKVITKPFFQFVEIDNRFLSSDKIFGNLTWGPRVKNTSWLPYFWHSSELLCGHCVKTEVRHDVIYNIIPKRLVWFQPFDLRRLTLLVNFNLYTLQITLQYAAFDLNLLVFDPGGNWCTLVDPSGLDDGYKLICLLTNTLFSMYHVEVFLFTTHVSKLVDCIFSFTLEDKGVFKGKEEEVHVRSPGRLQYTMILWPVFTIPSHLKKRVLYTEAFASKFKQGLLTRGLELFSSTNYGNLLQEVRDILCIFISDPRDTLSLVLASSFALDCRATSYSSKVMVLKGGMPIFDPGGHDYSIRDGTPLDCDTQFATSLLGYPTLLPDLLVDVTNKNYLSITSLQWDTQPWFCILEDKGDFKRGGVYGCSIHSYVSATNDNSMLSKEYIESMSFTIRWGDVLMPMKTCCYTRLEKGITLYNICFLRYKFKGGGSTHIFIWDPGDTNILVELLRILNESRDSLVAIFHDIEVETNCRRSIILCNARAMKFLAGNSRKSNVMQNEFLLDFHYKVSIITSKRSENTVGCQIRWITQVSHFVFDPGGEIRLKMTNRIQVCQHVGCKRLVNSSYGDPQIYVFDPGGWLMGQLIYVVTEICLSRRCYATSYYYSFECDP